MTAKKRKQAEKATTVVYCGPTIPGVAKHYTFYRGGVPDTLKAAQEQIPALGGLLVPLEKLPEAMRQLREGTGPIYTLYHVVQENH